MGNRQVRRSPLPNAYLHADLAPQCLCLVCRSRRKPAERDSIDAPRPAREMALIGKAGAGCNLRQACLPLAEKRGRPRKPEMDDAAMRGHPDRSLEHAVEMERAAIGDCGKRRDLYRLVDMRQHIGFETAKDFFLQ